jgi:pyruvate/2-oxoglutarate dehydrogenase complex dihydrolipoamide acyltransferase (E2) component
MYQPQADSLAGRVCAYFFRHGEEELSTGDIAIKFDANANSVSALLAGAVTNGLLNRTKNAGGFGTYSKGPKLAAAMTAPAAPPPKAATPAPPPAPLPPPTALTIEAGVPLPPAAGRRTPERDAFVAVFDKMKKGDSFAITSDACKRLHNLANSWGKTCTPRRKFSMRRLDAKNARIWRAE